MFLFWARGFTKSIYAAVGSKLPGALTRGEIILKLGVCRLWAHLQHHQYPPIYMCWVCCMFFLVLDATQCSITTRWCSALSASLEVYFPTTQDCLLSTPKKKPLLPLPNALLNGSLVISNDCMYYKTIFLVPSPKCQASERVWRDSTLAHIYKTPSRWPELRVAVVAFHES